MLYFTQLIYIHKDREESFQEFESVVLPLLSKYNGSLLLRMRPDEDSFIEGDVEMPYEIQLVSFPDEESFNKYSRDEVRLQFLHLKEQSVRDSLLIRGITIP